jgi:glycosyltransferase involved in cell wall biosynthesis
VPAKPPRVSVVMTTYNSERHLEEAVRSIRQQVMRDFELVVVDDGSTDKTRNILARHVRQDRRIRVLLVPRCGRIPALNQGVRAAKAELVAIQDADDVSYPNRLQLEADFLDSHEGKALVGSATVDRIDDDGKSLPPVRRPTDERKVIRLLGRIPAFFHSSVMYRKTAWTAVGGYDERLPCYEDYDLWVRMASQYGLALVEQPLAAKRRHPGQAFDQVHWTSRGYRTRAGINWRYFRHVRHDPVVLMRAGVFLAMNRPLLQAWRWLKGETRKDQALQAALGPKQ